MRLRVPYRFAFVFSSTLRFFPLLFQEAQTIFEAQRLRGVPRGEDVGPQARTALRQRRGAFDFEPLVKSQTLEVVFTVQGFFWGCSAELSLRSRRLVTADYVLLAAAALVLPRGCDRLCFLEHRAVRGADLKSASYILGASVLYFEEMRMELTFTLNGEPVTVGGGC